jgi:hypothetical protein
MANGDSLKETFQDSLVINVVLMKIFFGYDAELRPVTRWLMNCAAFLRIYE